VLHKGNCIESGGAGLTIVFSEHVVLAAIGLVVCIVGLIMTYTGITIERRKGKEKGTQHFFQILLL
jgi:hypothetical protein